MPGILSPSVKNLVIGKGFALFQPDYAITPYHLGNCPKLTYTPKVIQLPHFSEMAGTKVQDFSVITQKGGELSIDMEERTLNNLSLFFLADEDITNPTQPKIDIFSKLSAIQGQFWFYATNDVGPRWNMYLSQVILNPTSPYEPISDAYAAMTVQAVHVIDSTGLWVYLQLQPDVSTVAPQNVLLPFITGPQLPGDVPAASFVGEIMTANI